MSTETDPAAEAAAGAGPVQGVPVATGPLASSAVERWMSFAVALWGVAGLGTTVIWAAEGGGHYWPCWVWLGGAAAISAPALWLHIRSLPQGPERWLVAHAEISGSLTLFLLFIWLFANTHGFFWPLWPLISLVLLFVLHGLVAYRDSLPPLRARRLSARIETLTRTRRGALDVQAAELRRIERDLHDGAQARLVALSMQLGRAEARLADRPEEAALVKAARQEAGAAIRELRDLARGIAPPVLADRGLHAAVGSLAERASVPVTVNAEALARRPVPAVESAAYFVVAEALTNVAKHAGEGVSARVTLALRNERLLIDVADDGAGGADPAAGSGLEGLRARVAALDGTLTVISPAGGPTVVHAELPCES